jgi:predicted transcriptional regulator
MSENSENVYLARDIVVAYISKNSIAKEDIGPMLRRVYADLSTLGEPTETPKPELVPAVPIKKSVFSDYIVCLDDGKKLKMLKKHLAALGMTPEQYRTKWGLPADYPIVAPNYAEKRSELAKQAGLGKKRPELADAIVMEKPKRKKAA